MHCLSHEGSGTHKAKAVSYQIEGRASPAQRSVRPELARPLGAGCDTAGVQHFLDRPDYPRPAAWSGREQ